MALRGTCRASGLSPADRGGRRCARHVLRVRDGRRGKRLRRDAIRPRTGGAARPRSGHDRFDPRRAALDDTGSSVGDRAWEAATPHAEPRAPHEGRTRSDAVRMPGGRCAVPGDGPGRLQHRGLRDEHAGRDRGAARDLAVVPVDISSARVRARRADGGGPHHSRSARRSCGPRARRPHAPRFLAGRRGGVRGASARHRDSRRRGRSAARKLRGGVVMDDRERVWRAEFPIADRGARVEFVRSPDRVRVPLELFERAVDERTAAVCTGHVYFTTGWIQDVRALAQICHRKGAVLVVDAYQSIGAIPFDVAASGVDYLVGGTLKWLMGGPGIAYLYARGTVAERARPSAVGWWGVKEPFAFDVEHLDYGAGARRFEYGTPAVAAIYAARAGLELLAEVGIETVRERHKLLSQRLVDGALEQGWTIRCPRDAEERTPIVTLEHPDPTSAVTALRGSGLICDTRPGLIRLSPHYFNTLEEMDRALALLEPLRVAHAVA